MKIMNTKLFIQAIIKYIFGVLIVGSLLFIPANSFEYWNGWLFMGLLFIPMFVAGIILMFIARFIIADLNYRYK